jgi:hypothetical protein
MPAAHRHTVRPLSATAWRVGRQREESKEPAATPRDALTVGALVILAVAFVVTRLLGS